MWYIHDDAEWYVNSQSIRFAEQRSGQVNCQVVGLIRIADHQGYNPFNLFFCGYRRASGRHPSPQAA